WRRLRRTYRGHLAGCLGAGGWLPSALPLAASRRRGQREPKRVVASVLQGSSRSLLSCGRELFGRLAVLGVVAVGAGGANVGEAVRSTCADRSRVVEVLERARLAVGTAVAVLGDHVVLREVFDDRLDAERLRARLVASRPEGVTVSQVVRVAVV